jgi:hypothetical protein
MFRVLPIDGHGMNKRLAKKNLPLTKSKYEKEKGLKCATPKSCQLRQLLGFLVF